MSQSPYQSPAVEDDSSERSWKRRGLCVIDPERFFPREANLLAAQPAKKICQECPVIVECRNWALTHEEFGIWGGMTERERRHRQEEDFEELGIPKPLLHRRRRPHLTLVR